MRVRMRKKKSKKSVGKRTKERTSIWDTIQKKMSTTTKRGSNMNKAPKGSISGKNSDDLNIYDMSKEITDIKNKKTPRRRHHTNGSKSKISINNLNVRKIAILCIAIVIIIILIGLCFKTDKKMTPGGIEVVETNIKEEEEITEEQAKKTAVKQFKKLKENIKQEDLKVLKIQRSGEEYYYITSSQNSLEIKIKGGQVTRINSASVEE